MLRQFFMGMPKELDEAASIDGCSPLQTFMKVMLPNAVPMMVTIVVFSLVWYWNDYYLSSMFFNNNPPLSQKLTELSTLLDFSGQVTTITKQELVFLKEGILACGCLVTILPPLILYIFAQKFFTEGLERSGIVG
jgi:multiple sugar transport system permease protein